jgi:hypothetical protein
VAAKAVTVVLLLPISQVQLVVLVAVAAAIHHQAQAEPQHQVKEMLARQVVALLHTKAAVVVEPHLPELLELLLVTVAMVHLLIHLGFPHQVWVLAVTSLAVVAVALKTQLLELAV